MITSQEKFKLGSNNRSKSLEVTWCAVPLDLKFRVTIDVRSTVSYIKNSLSKLDNYMIILHYNVSTFNDFV